MISDLPIMFLFLPICYAAVFLKFTYYAQEQELWSEYYAIYIQAYMNKLLLVDNFRKTCFIRVYL